LRTLNVLIVLDKNDKKTSLQHAGHLRDSRIFLPEIARSVKLSTENKTYDRSKFLFNIFKGILEKIVLGVKQAQTNRFIFYTVKFF
jgi:hypothetical protein